MKDRVVWSWQNERKLVVWTIVAFVAVLALWGLIIVPLWIAAGMLWYMTIFNVGLLAWSLWNTSKIYTDFSDYKWREFQGVGRRW